MATEIRLVKHNWGYDMTSDDESYLILSQSLNVVSRGVPRHAPPRNCEI